jgi:hypothetical protein
MNRTPPKITIPTTQNMRVIPSPSPSSSEDMQQEMTSKATLHEAKNVGHVDSIPPAVEADLKKVGRRRELRTLLFELVRRAARGKDEVISKASTPPESSLISAASSNNYGSDTGSFYDWRDGSYRRESPYHQGKETSASCSHFHLLGSI